MAKRTHTPTRSHTHTHGAMIVQPRRLPDYPIGALFSCAEEALERIVPACKSECLLHKKPFKSSKEKKHAIT